MNSFTRALPLPLSWCQRPTTLNKMGACLVNLRRFDDGVQHFQRALALDADNIAAHYNLAAGTRREMLTTSGVECQCSLLPTMFALTNVLILLVTALANTGKLADAMVHCEAVLKIDPQFAPVCRRRRCWMFSLAVCVLLVILLYNEINVGCFNGRAVASALVTNKHTKIEFLKNIYVASTNFEIRARASLHARRSECTRHNNEVPCVAWRIRHAHNLTFVC